MLEGKRIMIYEKAKDQRHEAGADTGFKWGGGARFFRNKKINN